MKLRYEAAFMDMTDASSPLKIRDGQNAVAFKTTELVGIARGSGVAAGVVAMVKDLYESELETLKNRVAQREQHVGRRRQRYGRNGRGLL